MFERASTLEDPKRKHVKGIKGMAFHNPCFASDTVNLETRYADRVSGKTATMWGFVYEAIYAASLKDSPILFLQRVGGMGHSIPILIRVDHLQEVTWIRQ